ncbi:MAG TPA: BPSS1780 family membrane protein, partial [Albitalea sp.]|nr:BPSS1780 family membrane protein [Albitalea sp.]
MDETTSSSPSPRSVDGGRGVSWWSDAWTLFTKQPGMWVVFGLILMVLFGIMGVVPLLGSLAASLLAPVFAGSWMMAARKVDAGGELQIDDLFAGFRQKLVPLLTLGALLLAAMVAIGVVVGMMGFGAAMGVMMGGSARSAGGMAAAMGAGMLGMLVALALAALVAMAMWFAPTLVVFRGVAPVDALKASFDASLKNIVAFLLYGVLYLVAAVVASIPFGLGWVVLVPLM